MPKTGITIEQDRQADTAYFSLDIGEPCYCEEYDDALLVERGIFSNLIGGFQVLDFSRYKQGKVSINRLKDLFRAMLVENSHLAIKLQDRSEIIEAALAGLDKKLDALVSP